MSHLSRKKEVHIILIVEREVDGERNREGSGRVSGSFNSERLTHIWLPEMMDSANHTLLESDPSFRLLPPLLLIPNPSSQPLAPEPAAPPACVDADSKNCERGGKTFGRILPPLSLL